MQAKSRGKIKPASCERSTPLGGRRERRFGTGWREAPGANERKRL